MPLAVNEPKSLLVHSIFHTIQGEGIFAGHPAYFVRLAGCNIKCPMCDTDYTKGAEKLNYYYTIHTLEQMGCHEDSLVVITGGEPFRQNLSELVDELLFNIGCKVQIETNGTLPPTLSRKALNHPQLYIMCSPKMRLIDKELAPYISAYKYVLHADYIDQDGLPVTTLAMKAITARPPKDQPRPIYVQPVDVSDEIENKRHLESCVRVAMKHNYILCLQVHKLIGVE